MPPKKDKKKKESDAGEDLVIASTEDPTEDITPIVRKKPKEEKSKPAKPKESPKPPEPRLNARQFLRARKIHFRRGAGFLLDMKIKFKEHARKPMAEWQIHWDAFWKRPVK